VDCSWLIVFSALPTEIGSIALPGLGETDKKKIQLQTSTSRFDPTAGELHVNVRSCSRRKDITVSQSLLMPG